MSTRFILVAAAAIAAAAPAAAQSQKIVPNNALAEEGSTLFLVNGCIGCHTIGQGRTAGPDLLNVTARRDTAWLRRFLNDPPAMVETDSIAKAMLEEASGLVMPKFELSPAEWRALLHYLARESAKVSPRK